MYFNMRAISATKCNILTKVPTILCMIIIRTSRLCCHSTVMLSLCLFLALATNAWAAPSAQIVGGEEVRPPGKYGWQGTYKCTSTVCCTSSCKEVVKVFVRPPALNAACLSRTTNDVITVGYLERGALNPSFICGCILVDTRTVLTAAHCADSFTP